MPTNADRSPDPAGSALVLAWHFDPRDGGADRDLARRLDEQERQLRRAYVRRERARRRARRRVALARLGAAVVRQPRSTGQR